MPQPSVWQPDAMRLVNPGTPGATPVRVTSLEMTAPPEMRVPTPAGAALVVVDAPRPDLSRDFYANVGGDWHWVDRRDWTLEQWTAWVDRPEHHLLICEHEGDPAGYAELEEQPGGHVEIAYFGLLSQARGHGLGRWWLAAVTAYAWSLSDTGRVWVRTCDLDSPAALPNYLRRGFAEFAEETEWRLPTT